ncbi:MAG: efflux RND transporter periplasmic adaptor subunit [Acidobacteria bacterium]|nr:efflux RND transporter periplasmic adaptor subunit [Acidobacteriota bacterium]
MRKTAWAATLILILLVAGVALFFYIPSRDHQTLVFSGTVEAEEVALGSRVGGRISEVLVQEGQLASQGELLVRLDAYDLPARKEQAFAMLREAMAQLDKLRRGFRPEEIAQARAAADAARARLELLQSGARSEEIERAHAELEAARANTRNAQVVYQRLSALLEKGVVSRQMVDDARTGLERAQSQEQALEENLNLLLAGNRAEEIRAAESQAAEAEARLRLVQAGFRREDIDAAAANVEQARAQLQAIEAQLSETEIRAPAAGVVESLSVRPGDLAAAHASIITLLEPDQVYVKVYVPESHLALLRPGKPVQISVDTFPGREFPGTIASIAHQGEFTPRNIQTREEREHQVFAVRVRPRDPTGLRPGMAAEVKADLSAEK